MRALCFDRFGGPEVLEARELEDPVAGAGEVIVRTEAIGLNYADVYRRRGTYHLVGQPPYILGYEAAGTVDSVGPGVVDVTVGTAVVFADVPLANASLVRVPVEHLILRHEVDAVSAAAVTLQGLTAQFLVEDTFEVAAQHRVVVQAAAGGVGRLLVQMAKARGAVVVGLCSSEAKADRVRAAGADHAIVSGEHWVDDIRALPGFEEGADVVYDSVGVTLLDSLGLVRRRGTAVTYGMAGGSPPLIDPAQLLDESKAVVGGDLWNVLDDQATRQRQADRLYAAIADGDLEVTIAATFPLNEGAAAHRLLEDRSTSGKVLLIP